MVVQDRLGGTGHAVRMVTEALGDLPGTVVVTYGGHAPAADADAGRAASVSTPPRETR